MYNVKSQDNTIVSVRGKLVNTEYGTLIAHKTLEYTLQDTPGGYSKVFSDTGKSWTISEYATGTALFTQDKKTDALRYALAAIENNPVQFARNIAYTLEKLGRAN